MKKIICEGCGSNDLYEENGYLVCKYCGTKHLMTAEDKPEKESAIDLNSDIERLLQRCREDPARAKKCAERILELDPANVEAKRILGISDNKSHSTSSGCYVATAVYGSYNCPQVWTLRRYRDNTLAKTWYGRAFIRIYYAISPTLVKWFGNTAWFKNMWKPKLDKMVKNLNQNGVENTLYSDREW